jgi:DNA-binding NtrC family response regulator
MSSPQVLVVDDDVGMVDTLGDILTASGYDVARAYSGEAAVTMVQHGPYDVVLMDIQMPGLNGVEALGAMKTLAPRMSVIMMTAFTRHELAEEARRQAALAILSKPLDLERTLALISGAVRGQGSA